MVSTRADFAKVRSIIAAVQTAKDRIEYHATTDLKYIDTQLKSLLNVVEHVELSEYPDAQVQEYNGTDTLRVDGVYTVFWSPISEQYIVVIRSKSFLKSTVFVAYLEEIDNTVRTIRCETTTQKNLLALCAHLQLVIPSDNIVQSVVEFFNTYSPGLVESKYVHLCAEFSEWCKCNTAHQFNEPWRQWRYIVSRLKSANSGR